MKQGLGKENNAGSVERYFFSTEKDQLARWFGLFVFHTFNTLFCRAAAPFEKIRDPRTMFRIRNFSAVLSSRIVTDMFYRIPAESFSPKMKTFCGINYFFTSRTARYRKLFFPQRFFGKSEECSNHFYRKLIIGFRFDYRICSGKWSPVL